MERELVELFESAKKAADVANVKGVLFSSAEVTRCTDALKRLQRFPVTTKVLAPTRIAKRLELLTHHKNQKIKSAASCLLEVWKQRIKTHEEKDDSRKPPEVKVKDQDKKGHRIIRVKLRPKATSHPDGNSKPSFKCNDASRDKVREILVEAFSKVATEVDGDQKMKERVSRCDPIHTAVSLESEMFAMLGPSDGNRKQNYRSILSNISNPKNPGMRRKVLLGQMKPQWLITMTIQIEETLFKQFDINKFKEVERALLKQSAEESLEEDSF